MSISFFNEDSFLELSQIQESEIIFWIEQSALLYEYSIDELNYIFCSDRCLLEINQSHLNHDTLTDIITFDLSEEENIISGDIFISVDRVSENSKIFNTSFSKELARVLIHGVLHLVGFNDKSDNDSRIMREREDFHIKDFNIDIIY